MIVTCPSCSVRYMVDAHALGAKGRMVRCARCSHTWEQAASESELASAPPPRPPPPPIVKGPAAAAAAPPPAEPPEQPVEPRPASAAALTAGGRVQLPAVQRRRRVGGAALAWGLTLAAILVGLGYAAIVERDRIVAFAPATAELYTRAGFAVNDNGIGLEFRNVTTSRETTNGLPALVISGEVRNVSSVARAVPKVVVVLRDKGDRALQDVTVPMSSARLAPGESMPFHTSITQPAEAASGVVVTFAGGGG